MSFGAPLWLFALALPPVLVVLFFLNEKRRRVLLEKIVAARLQPELAGSVSIAKRRARFFIFLAGLACVIVSLAQPRYGYTWEQSKRKGRDVIIAIDTSKSMLSTDVTPNRLTRAKLAALDLINQLQGDRVGVVAFAGNAFLQAPLTIDYGAVTASIDELDTNIIPRGGTDIAAAIRCAAEAFGKGESENRCLILMTDGEDLGTRAVEAARGQAENFHVFTVGVGTADGSIIPVPEQDGGTEFVKDPQGQFVKSRLDESTLRQIAEVSNGFYAHLDSGPATMKRIISEGLGKVKERDIDARQSRRPIERYQWPLALGLLLLAVPVLISERRRTGIRKSSVMAVQAAVLALLLFLPVMTHARNAGLDLYESQKYKDAYQLFEKQIEHNPNSEGLYFDAGAAAYKLGEYDKALDAFSKALTSRTPELRSKVEYNLGNTLVRRGELQQAKEAKIKEWRNALQHYDEATKIDAKNEEAKLNRDAVEKLIKELEKEPPKQDKDKKDQDKDQKKDQRQEQQPKSDQNKDQKQQDQKDQNQKQHDSDKNKESQDQQQKDQKSGDQKDKGQQRDSGSKDQQEQQQPDSEKKDEQGKESKENQQQKQDDQKQQGQQQNGGDSKQNQSQAASSPAPEQEPDKKLSGEIQAQQNNEKSDSQAQAEVPVEEKPGEMSETQARMLVESLKNEEQRVELNERKGSAPVLKDW